MPCAPSNAEQASLFDLAPSGLAHAENFISAAEEKVLLSEALTLDFKPFAFQGWAGNRETISYGWRYDFNESRIYEAPPIPAFLLPLRSRVAEFAGLDARKFEQASMIRYAVGAGIGWHRDRPVFEKVVGISLASPCVLRFRRRDGSKFRRFALDARPRSIYLLNGEIRHEWEHSIAPMTQERYSITFRSRA